MTIDAALRNLVALGVPFEQAVRTVTAAPAAALGRRDVGRLDVGRLDVGGRADVAVLDDDLTVLRVLVAGVAM